MVFPILTRALPFYSGVLQDLEFYTTPSSSWLYLIGILLVQMLAPADTW